MYKYLRYKLKCNILSQRPDISAAATGGLLGLGFGFSMLSAAEILYFIMIRWCYHHWQVKKEQAGNAVLPFHQTQESRKNSSEAIRNRVLVCSDSFFLKNPFSSILLYLLFENVSRITMRGPLIIQLILGRTRVETTVKITTVLSFKKLYALSEKYYQP